MEEIISQNEYHLFSKIGLNTIQTLGDYHKGGSAWSRIINTWRIRKPGMQPTKWPASTIHHRFS